MAGRTRNYYAGGNTALGFHSLYESNLAGLERLFILKGGPGTGKSSLMRKTGKKWLENGFDVEYLHCSSDNDSIDGVIIPQLKVGVVDGTAPHVIEPKAPGAVEEYVNLGAAWDSRRLSGNKDEILQLTAQIGEAFQNAYAAFAQALKIHDQWEKIYIENMDFAKADRLTAEWIKMFLGERSLAKKADVRHRFFGAATPNGPVDFIQNLTEDLAKRYFIKGRPGTGKSTMLKVFAAEAAIRGFDVEVYHCGFDPHSLDMVLVRELELGVFDSTAPHEYFPEMPSDEIIDFYQLLVVPGTDEKHAAEIGHIVSAYSAGMKEATSYLARAKALHDELEEYYIEAMDFTVVDGFRDDINSEIEKMSTAKPGF